MQVIALMLKIKNGLVINLEGTDGCGKTTQVGLLCKALQEQGFETAHVKEPGGTVLADKLRELLIDKTSGIAGCHVGVEVMMFMAAKIDLYQRVVLPALEAGKIVVCERGWISLFAYQAGGRQGSLQSLEQLKRLSHEFFGTNIGPFNGLQILLDQSLDQSRDRVRSRSQNGGLKADRFETEDDRFLRDMDSLYRIYFKARIHQPVVVLEAENIYEHYQTVDINGTDIQTTHERVMAVVRQRLSQLQLETTEEEKACPTTV